MPATDIVGIAVKEYPGDRIAVDLEHGMVYPLTDCCGASGKGGGMGVICRKCYEDVDIFFGMGWTITEAADTMHCEDCGDTLNWCPKSPLNGKGTRPDES